MRMQNTIFTSVLFLLPIGLMYHFFLTDNKQKTPNLLKKQEEFVKVESNNTVIKSNYGNDNKETSIFDKKNKANNATITKDLQEIYIQMKDYDKRWDKNIQYEKVISTFFSENLFSQLEFIFLDSPTKDSEALSKQAINRVIGLKIFEYGINKGSPEINIEAKSIIKKLNSELREKGNILKNQHLDLEAMIRIYLNAHPEVFDDKNKFLNLSNELGIDLAEIRKYEMTTPYSVGIVTGILTSAKSIKKFKQVEAWIWES